MTAPAVTRVVWGADGSAAAFRAARLARELLDRAPAHLAAVTVVPRDERVGGRAPAALRPSQGVIARKEAALAALHWPGAGVESIVRAGSPGDQIVAVARELRADLIVLGGGEADPAGAGGTRVVDAVLDAATCPVLIGRDDRPWRKLVLAIDLGALDALLHALRRFTPPTALVWALHITPATDAPLPSGRGAKGRQSQPVAREVADALRRLGIRADGLESRGRIADEILHAAESSGADAIVLAAARAEGAARAAERVATAEVVHRAAVSLLVVPLGWTGGVPAERGRIVGPRPGGGSADPQRETPA